LVANPPVVFLKETLIYVSDHSRITSALRQGLLIQTSASAKSRDYSTITEGNLGIARRTTLSVPVSLDGWGYPSLLVAWNIKQHCIVSQQIAFSGVLRADGSFATEQMNL